MKILLGILIGGLLGLLGGFAYLGLFHSMDVTEREMGPYQFVYVQDTSSNYSRVWELTEALGKRLDEAGYKTRKPAQVFFRTERGIQNQIGFFVDRAVSREVLGAETYFRPVPVQRYMVANFPFRNLMSFRVGAWRATSAFERHRKARNYGDTSAMVILEGGEILYLQPIEPG